MFDEAKELRSTRCEVDVGATKETGFDIARLRHDDRSGQPILESSRLR